MAKMAAPPRVATFEAVGGIFVAAAVEIDHQHGATAFETADIALDRTPMPPLVPTHDRPDRSVAPSLPVASKASVCADRLARSRVSTSSI
jgi:hypothetical protein